MIVLLLEITQAIFYFLPTFTSICLCIFSIYERWYRNKLWFYFKIQVRRLGFWYWLYYFSILFITFIFYWGQKILAHDKLETILHARYSAINKKYYLCLLKVCSLEKAKHIRRWAQLLTLNAEIKMFTGHSAQERVLSAPELATEGRQNTCAINWVVKDKLM